MASVCTVKCFFGGRVWKPGEVCEDDTGKCPWFKAVGGQQRQGGQPAPAASEAVKTGKSDESDKRDGKDNGLGAKAPAAAPAPATPAKRKAKKNGDEN